MCFWEIFWRQGILCLPVHVYISKQCCIGIFPDFEAAYVVVESNYWLLNPFHNYKIHCRMMMTKADWMPCRSPQTVSVAQPTPYLSMSQQHFTGQQPQPVMVSQLQPQPPPPLPPTPSSQQAQQSAQQSSQQSQQNGNAGGKKQVAREGYNEKAMAVIRNSLRPFEQADQPLRPVSALSTGSSSGNNNIYSDCIQSLQSMGIEEVRTMLIFYNFSPVCVT